MADNDYTWDFFIAHAAADKPLAEGLYDALEGEARVFLDTRCIELGDDWDLALRDAQKSSRVCVILVSERTESAYYQREEIAAAIDLARSRKGAYRVVPVYLGEAARRSEDVPYGLRLKHGLTFSEDTGWAPVAARLLQVLRRRLRPILPGLRLRSPHPEPTERARGGRARASLWGGAALGGLVAAALAATLVGWGPGSDHPDTTGPSGDDAFSAQESEGMIETVNQLPAPASNGGGAEEGAGSAAKRPHCVRIEHLSPNLIPHYLLKSVGNRNFPYLLKLTAVNDCGEPRDVYLRFETGENVEMAEQTKRFPLPYDGAPRTRIFEPRFTLASKTTESIKIHWSVEDEKSTKVDVGTIETDIVPPHTLAWDLKRPATQGEKGQPVDPDYLLASLAAWTLSPPKVIRERARACRSQPGAAGKLTKRAAIASCYEALFQGDTGVYVVESTFRFPDGPRQRINPHEQVLEEDLATPLEAALLFTAVMEAEHVESVDETLVLLVSPLDAQKDQGRKTAYIAWTSEDGAWQAIDMMQANGLGFEDNVAAASRNVVPILQYNTEIRSAITGTGAGWSSDRTIAAVHFRNLDPRYRIRRLP